MQKKNEKSQPLKRKKWMRPILNPYISQIVCVCMKNITDRGGKKNLEKRKLLLVMHIYVYAIPSTHI